LDLEAGGTVEALKREQEDARKIGGQVGRRGRCVRAARKGIHPGRDFEPRRRAAAVAPGEKQKNARGAEGDESERLLSCR